MYYNHSFMRPNTLHTVLSTSNCISYGQHFYTTSTILDTCWAIIHLAALALMLLCAASVGHLFLRRCPFESLVERLVFTLALGLGLCALLLFILGLLGILYRSLIWVLTVAGAMALVLNFINSTRRSLGISQWKRTLTLRNGKDLFSLRNAVIVLLTFLAVGCCFLLIVRAQYPPTNWDSISNHLVIAREERAIEDLGVA